MPSDRFIGWRRKEWQVFAQRIRNRWKDGTLPSLAVVFAMLVVLRAPGYANSGLLRAVAELLLIIAGVLFGMLLVPDTSKGIVDSLDLDLRRAPEVVSSMTELAWEEMVRSFIAARSSGEVAEMATSNGCFPIMRAATGAGRQFRRDMTYSVELRALDVAGQRMYKAESRHSCRRSLPGENVWISFARTAEALRGEFAEASCLSRELAEFEPLVWQELANQGMFRARMKAGVWEDGGGTPEWLQGNDLLRLHFAGLPAATAGQAPTEVVVWSTFALPYRTTFFPVRFASYFCRGQTRVTFRIEDDAVTDLEAFVSFAGDLELDPRREVFKVERLPGDPCRAEVSTTSDEVLLWPGSGVSFVWSRDGVP
ncbi:MAG: hypothetical protein ACRD2W_14735 [Acidimicrobiales bacterium]